MSQETITLAGGRFWCLEAVYEQVQGVLAVECGYCNGQGLAPGHAQVEAGQTGHAQVVQVGFDAAQVPLRELLEIFFAVHDPTSLNRQGDDVGTQYRSGIYVDNPVHEAVAREVLAEVQAAHGGRVVTELLPLNNYSRAEHEQQHYCARHPQQGFCAAVVAPKLAELRRHFAARLRP